MFTERMKPEAPSSAPATISSLLSSTNPISGGGKSGVGIQQRDHRRHVGAADRDDQQHAEDQRRSPTMTGNKRRVRGMQHQVNGQPDGDGQQYRRLTMFCP